MIYLEDVIFSIEECSNFMVGNLIFIQSLSPGSVSVRLTTIDELSFSSSGSWVVFKSWGNDSNSSNLSGVVELEFVLCAASNGGYNHIFVKLHLIYIHYLFLKWFILLDFIVF